MIEYICENCYKNKGYVLWGFSKPSNQNSVCYKCGLPLTETNLTRKEIRIINETTDDVNFLKAMMELKDKDIIEFNLKLSQFENQIKQNQNIKQQSSNNSTQQQQNTENQIHCPYCKSTNVQKISVTSRAGSAMMFGILSKKIGKNYHCNNCKSDF